MSTLKYSAAEKKVMYDLLVQNDFVAARAARAYGRLYGRIPDKKTVELANQNLNKHGSLIAPRVARRIRPIRDDFDKRLDIVLSTHRVSFILICSLPYCTKLN